MKLIADEQIPLLECLISKKVKIIRVPSHEINHKLIKKADALFIRSTVKINQDLIENTKIRFIGSAVSGRDHIDEPLLENQGIHLSHANGCNANSVAEYILACIALLPPEKLKIGIIGLGQVGQNLFDKLKVMGHTLVCNDPPRAQCDPFFGSTPLSEFKDCDLITIHTPLITRGDLQTIGLINEDLVSKQKKHCLIINTARGMVFDPLVLDKYPEKRYIFDVYPNEPDLPRGMIHQAMLATPHIAGHSIQAKWRGSEMICEAFNQFFDFKTKILKTYPIEKPTINLASCKKWQDVILSVYDPRRDSRHLKSSIETDIKACFQNRRMAYPIRHEFTYPTYLNAHFDGSDKDILEGLGFSL